MTRRISFVTLLLFAALAPIEGRPALIDVSDFKITAFASAKTQLSPEKSDFDIKVVPAGDPTKAEALVLADGIPFPNLSNNPGQAFASAAGDGRGNFGVGVNGFFFRNSLPPNALEAALTMSQTITNNSNVSVGISANFFIPPPTFQFFGIGNSFPGGVDPGRDAAAVVNARIVTRLTRPDGSIVEDIPLDYGMELFRDPVGGALFAIPTVDAEGEISAFDEPDGSFGFALAFRLVEGLKLSDIGPGDIFEFTYEFFAAASTGFGETGIFAAIGDPFNLSVGGGRFELQVGDPIGPGPGQGLPEPSTSAMLGLGLFLLSVSARRGRQPRRLLCNRS